MSKTVSDSYFLKYTPASPNTTQNNVLIYLPVTLKGSVVNIARKPNDK